MIQVESPGTTYKRTALVACLFGFNKPAICNMRSGHHLRQRIERKIVHRLHNFQAIIAFLVAVFNSYRLAELLPLVRGFLLHTIRPIQHYWFQTASQLLHVNWLGLHLLSG